MSAVASQDAIERLPLFRSLPSDARESLARQCRLRRCAPQETIIDRDDPGRDVYFLVEGRVRVVNYSLSGREITFDDLAEGSYFGELSALDDRPRSANVIALGPAVIAVVPQAVFVRLVSEFPAASLEALRNMAKVLRRATERIMDLSTLGANNRVHAEILRLAKDGQAGNTATIVPIPLHGDIASRVSTTRETVARVFSDLARMGLVERQQDKLYIKELDKLAEMVDEVRGDVAGAMS